MASAAELYLKATADVTQVTKQLGILNQQIAGASSTLDSGGGAASRLTGALKSGAKAAAVMGAGGILAAGAGLASAATSGLQFNNSMEQTMARLNAFTKDGAASADILEMIRNRAARTPFAFEEMASAAAGLLPASKTSGKALEDLISTAEVLAASNPAEGLEGSAFALREALSGDFTSVFERFNLPRQAINQLKAEGVPAIEAINQVMRDMGLDADLVSKMGTTMSGRWSTFKDTLTGLAATATAGVFSGLSTGLGTLQGYLDANQERLSALATTVGTTLAGAFNWVVSTGIPAMITGWQTLQPLLVATGGFIAGSVVPALATLLGWLQQNADWLGKVAIVVGGAVAAFATISTVVGIVMAVVTAISGLWAAVSAGTPIIAGIVALLGGPLTLTIGAISVAVGVLTAVWSQNWFGIQEKTAAVINWFTGTAWPAVQGTFVAAGVALTTLQTLWGSVFAGIQTYIEGVKTRWNEFVTLIKAAGAGIAAVFGPIASAFGGFGSMLSSIKGALPWWLTPGSPTPLENALRGVASAIGPMGAAMGDLGKYLRFAESEGDWLNDWLTHLPAGAQDAALALGKMVEAGKMTAGQALAGVQANMGGTSDALQKYLDATRKTGDYRNDWIMDIPANMRDQAREMGKRVAAGLDPGVFPTATGGTAGGAGGAPSGTIGINIYIDGKPADGRVEVTGGWGNFRVALNQVAAT